MFLDSLWSRWQARKDRKLRKKRDVLAEELKRRETIVLEKQSSIDEATEKMCSKECALSLSPDHKCSQSCAHFHHGFVSKGLYIDCRGPWYYADMPRCKLWGKK